MKLEEWGFRKNSSGLRERKRRQALSDSTDSETPSQNNPDLTIYSSTSASNSLQVGRQLSYCAYSTRSPARVQQVSYNTSHGRQVIESDFQAQLRVQLRNDYAYRTYGG